jgi:hypothetical protein
MCAGPVAAETSGLKPDVSVRIDADPGHYDTRRASLTSSPGRPPEPLRVDFVFQKLQPSERFASTLVLCAYAGQDAPISCVVFYKMDGFRNLAVDVQSKSSADAKLETKRRSLGLPVDKKHRVDVSFEDHLVRFAVDGKPVSETHMDINPDSYSYTCSSVVCALDIYHPATRP